MRRTVPADPLLVDPDANVGAAAAFPSYAIVGYIPSPGDFDWRNDSV